MQCSIDSVRFDWILNSNQVDIPGLWHCLFFRFDVQLFANVFRCVLLFPWYSVACQPNSARYLAFVFWFGLVWFNLVCWMGECDALKACQHTYIHQIYQQPIIRTLLLLIRSLFFTLSFLHCLVSLARKWPTVCRWLICSIYNILLYV